MKEKRLMQEVVDLSAQYIKSLEQITYSKVFADRMAAYMRVREEAERLEAAKQALAYHRFGNSNRLEDGCPRTSIQKQP